jgi:hypothetical protein
VTSFVPAAWPSFIQTGTVVGVRMVAGIDTSADTDTHPDVTYPQGSTLEFAPSVPHLVFAHNSTDNLKGTTVDLTTVTGVIDGTGNIVTDLQTLKPLELIANKGQTANAQDWHWTCTPKIAGAKKDSFPVDINPGTNYLADQTRLTTSLASVSALVGPQGPPGVGAPPQGTPDNYVPHSINGATVWVDPATLGIGGGGGTGATTVAGITDASDLGKLILSTNDGPTIRSEIGAGTSNLALGTTAGTAKPGDYQPAIADIVGAGATGKAVLAAATTSAGRTALALGSAATANTTDFAAASQGVPTGGSTGQFLSPSGWATPSSVSGLAFDTDGVPYLTI